VVIIHFEASTYVLRAGHSIDLNSCSKFEEDILVFCQQYLDGQSEFVFSTSGSTGAPKTIRVSREHLAISAQNTLNYLNIQSESAALLCINPQFTGGRMMLVRAIERKMDIWVQNPSGLPDLKGDQEYDLVAMVPPQVKNLINQEGGAEQLTKCKHLLIGGAPMDGALEAKLRTIPTAIYHTFGMTETLSHFALKPLSGANASTSYQLLPGYSITQNEHQCLVVSGPVTDGKVITTHDVVEILDDQRFIWLGRSDQIINSGGFKIYPQKVESSFQKLFDAPCHLLARKDRQWGQQAVLMVESTTLTPEKIKSLQQELGKHLHPYEVPKKIVPIAQFPRTPNGKTDLAALRQHLPSG